MNIGSATRIQFDIWLQIRCTNTAKMRKSVRKWVSQPNHSEP